MYGPTLNIAGLRSGFLGKETGLIPFIIPSEAAASIDMRIVTETKSDDIIESIRKHLDSLGFNDSNTLFESIKESIETFTNVPDTVIPKLKNQNLKLTNYAINILDIYQKLKRESE